MLKTGKVFNRYFSTFFKIEITFFCLSVFQYNRSENDHMCPLYTEI